LNIRAITTAGLLTILLLGCSSDQAEESPGANESDQAPEVAQTLDGGDASGLDLPEGVTTAMVAQGMTVFQGQGACFTCHGATGEGTQIAPNLNDDEWLNVDGSYEQLLDLIDTGVRETKEFPGMMMPRGGSRISDEDLRAVAAYVWSLSRPSG
jgi:mono/diheme cytochrome c family protein